MSFHAARFGRSAPTYASHAEIQALMAERLVDILVESQVLSSGNGHSLLELGCGTGLLTRKLLIRLPDVSLWATDASQAMLDEAKKEFAKKEIAKTESDPSITLDSISQRVLGFSVLDASGKMGVDADIQSLTPFSGIASNALVQWFPNLSDHLRLVATLLKPNGFYLVSGFAQDNFPELNALLMEPPFNYQDFPGHERDAVNRASIQAGLQLLQWDEVSYEQIYSSAEAFLASISGLGSARRPNSTPLNRTRLVYLVDKYNEQNALPNGVKATWKPWYALMRKVE
jgi:malonyl-CoA O-methyltransferase